MPRVLKIHLWRPEEDATAFAMCGKFAKENGTTDPELITCNTCSGIYRTNVEWYSQVKNRALVAKNETGEGDIYTRQDLETGLMRLGWGMVAINAVLDDTKIFRNIELGRELRLKGEPWDGVTALKL